jgi:hypothetical protein
VFTLREAGLLLTRHPMLVMYMYNEKILMVIPLCWIHVLFFFSSAQNEHMAGWQKGMSLPVNHQPAWYHVYVCTHRTPNPHDWFRGILKIASMPPHGWEKLKRCTSVFASSVNASLGCSKHQVPCWSSQQLLNGPYSQISILSCFVFPLVINSTRVDF